jgi:FtsH-binding integral membrane protein
MHQRSLTVTEPMPSEPARTHAEPPESITRSVQVIYAIVALSLISLILTFFTAEDMLEAQGTEEVGTGSVITIAVISFIIFGALYLLFAVKLRQGAGWARIVLTVLSVLAVLLGLFGLFQGQPVLSLVIGLISLVLYIALLFFMWQKDASAYLASHKS